MAGNEQISRRCHDAYQAIFDHLNRYLFSERIDPVLLTFSRKRNAPAFYSNQVSYSKKTENREITMNILVPWDEKNLVVFAHELVHMWQLNNGSPSRFGYHNKEWSRKMESIGLIPSHTGKPGGTKTGQSVSQYILAGGLFEICIKKIQPALLLPLMELATEDFVITSNANYQKFGYYCSGCNVKVWGKMGLQIECKKCGLTLKY